MAPENNTVGLEITELRLGLSMGSYEVKNKKREFTDAFDVGSIDFDMKRYRMAHEEEEKGSKVVVGWPPIRSFRKSQLNQEKRYSSPNNEKLTKLYVKVSMDGAPYLRKIDLSAYESYSELSKGIAGLMFSIGTTSADKDGVDIACDYVVIHEDKDGDWMMVGDTPWEIFIDSCKRLRIMRKSDAINTPY